MEVVKFHELWVLTVCLLAGVVTGLVFDGFRAIRRCCSVSARAVAFHDILFWIITCVIVYMAIYISNSAELRWFELIGLAGGIGFYMLCMSRRCLHILCGVVRLICRIYAAVTAPLLAVTRLIGRIISPVADAAYSAGGSILYKLHKVFLKTSHKIRSFRKNICQKCFFTFLKR